MTLDEAIEYATGRILEETEMHSLDSNVRSVWQGRRREAARDWAGILSALIGAWYFKEEGL